MAKVVALLSGGLDSRLSILTVIRQGIEVRAIKFLTPFDPDISSWSSSSDTIFAVAREYGFDIEIRQLGEQFLEMVKNPGHGYGKNMNPCIDCRIMMLKEARALMEDIGANFIVTGEVLGQRPMSQQKDMLYHIDKEAGVKNYVLRPLSAKLLRITLPEAKGIIDRERLYGFNGRSRKPQMALAREFGLTEYPAPAGGCLLTEPNFAHKLKDLLTYDPHATLRDIELLKIGRHFRLSPWCKIITGRDMNENILLETLCAKDDALLKVEGHGSPVTLLTGKITEASLMTAASVCAKYSDAKHLPFVEVSVLQNGNPFAIIAEPAEVSLLDQLRIVSPQKIKEMVQGNYY